MGSLARKCHRIWEWSGESSSLLTMDRAFAAFRHVIALGAVIRDQSRPPQWQILGLRFSYPSALGTGTETARRLLRRPRGFVEKQPKLYCAHLVMTSQNQLVSENNLYTML